MTAEPAWTHEQHNALAAFMASRLGKSLDEAADLATEWLNAAYDLPDRSRLTFEQVVLRDRLYNVADAARSMLKAFEPWTGKTDKQLGAETALKQSLAFLDESLAKPKGGR